MPSPTCDHSEVSASGAGVFHWKVSVLCCSGSFSIRIGYLCPASRWTRTWSLVGFQLWRQWLITSLPSNQTCIPPFEYA